MAQRAAYRPPQLVMDERRRCSLRRRVAVPQPPKLTPAPGPCIDLSHWQSLRRETRPASESSHLLSRQFIFTIVLLMTQRGKYSSTPSRRQRRP